MATWHYIVGSSSDDYLTQTEIDENAVLLVKYLRSYGFSDIAIAGICGNIQAESGFNPGKCEIGHGVPTGNTDSNYAYGIGLIQWTKPGGGSINPLLRYAQEKGKNWYDGDLQAEYINHAASPATNYQLWGWYETPEYPISFADFKNLSTSPTNAAAIWVYNLERPGVDKEATAAYRGQLAENWYPFVQAVDSYEPRLSYEGTDTSPYYTTYNPYWSWGYVDLDGQTVRAWLGMNNCTAYAYGRWNELAAVTAFNTRWPTGNGADWVTDGRAKGYETGNTPRLGAAASWKKYDGNGKLISNHVAIVEEIQYDSNNNPVSFTISQSAFNHNQPPGRGPNMAGWNDFPWFWTDTVQMSDLDYGYGSGSFQGFVYHPDIVPGPPGPPGPGPVPPGTHKKMPLFLYLKNPL